MINQSKKKWGKIKKKIPETKWKLKHNKTLLHIKTSLRENFLDSFKPPKLNQEEIDPLNKSITNEEIKVIIKAFPLERFQVQMGSQQNTARHPNIYNTLLKFFDGGNRRGRKISSQLQSQYCSIPKPSKNTRKKKQNYRPISLIRYRDKVI